MKRWYVIQVYAGFEEQVKANLIRQIAKEELADLFGEVLIPSAKVKRFFEGQDSDEQQLFPGYVLIEMESTPQAIRLVTTTPRVIKFLGGQEPVPLSQKEVERIVSFMKGEVSVHAAETTHFIEGTEVEIVDGPFTGFMGLIDKVDKDAEKLSVMVSIFGRSTPVELRFEQVKR
jgi:transcriptional antiterminator NusG